MNNDVFNAAGSGKRIFSLEGALHIYSTLPVVVPPAELYRLDKNSERRQQIADSNIYLIVARDRIMIDANAFSLHQRTLTGRFIAVSQMGQEAIPFQIELTPEFIESESEITDVAVAALGTHVVVMTDDRKIPIPTYVIVAHAQSALRDEHRDLEVLYVGQGIGRSKQRSALDRLLRHSTLQRILADYHTYFPHKEILVMMYRFEYPRMIMSNGGNFNLEPSATADEDRDHMSRLGTFNLSRRNTVALAEAALIRHFQPRYNELLKESDFSAKRKIKIMEDLLSKDVTGLIVEICSANVYSRLGTLSALPEDILAPLSHQLANNEGALSSEEREEWNEQVKMIKHTVFARFPITTPAERDTFLHGQVWRDQ